LGAVGTVINGDSRVSIRGCTAIAFGVIEHNNKKKREEEEKKLEEKKLLEKKLLEIKK